MKRINAQMDILEKRKLSTFFVDNRRRDCLDGRIRFQSRLGQNLARFIHLLEKFVQFGAERFDSLFSVGKKILDGMHRLFVNLRCGLVRGIALG